MWTKSWDVKLRKKNLSLATNNWCQGAKKTFLEISLNAKAHFHLCLCRLYMVHSVEVPGHAPLLVSELYWWWGSRQVDVCQDRWLFPVPWTHLSGTSSWPLCGPHHMTLLQQEGSKYSHCAQRPRVQRKISLSFFSCFVMTFFGPAF